MDPVTATILSVIIVSLVSFSGILVLALNPKTLKSVLLELVAFAVGALLGGVFLHILPELAEELGFTLLVSALILAGFFVGFLIEKFVHLHHCRGGTCDFYTAEHDPKAEHGAKPYAIVNVLGDGVHNFVDGILIAASYLVSIPVGIATTLAVVLHEIPQEVGDFAVLVHAGWSRGKALFMNFLSALAALLGAVATLILGVRFEEAVPYVLPVAAGIFLYLAASDLIPELQKESRPLRSLAQFAAILVGIGVMAAFLLLE